MNRWNTMWICSFTSRIAWDFKVAKKHGNYRKLVHRFALDLHFLHFKTIYTYVASQSIATARGPGCISAGVDPLPNTPTYLHSSSCPSPAGVDPNLEANRGRENPRGVNDTNATLLAWPDQWYTLQTLLSMLLKLFVQTANKQHCRGKRGRARTGQRGRVKPNLPREINIPEKNCQTEKHL